MNRIEIDGLTFEIDVDKDECHTACVVGCDKSAEAVTIPSSITVDGITYTVTSIGEKAFEGCTSLKDKSLLRY